MNDALQTRRAAAERAAINGPIQGTAADLMRRATVRVHQALRDQALQARIVLQVHDELVVEAPTSEAAAVRALLCERMRTAAEPWVRLSVLPEVEIKAVEIKNGS